MLALTAAGTSAALSGLGVVTNVATLNLSAMSTTVTGAVVPALVALGTTLAPLTATVGTLAAGVAALGGAFGLVLGSGIVAGFDRLKDELQNSLFAIELQIARFGEQFVPLLSDAINALPGLVNETLAAVGGVQEFANALRNLGGQVADVIPTIVGGLFDLARVALPVFRDFIGFLSGRGEGVVNAFLQTTRRLSDELLGVGDAILDVLPTVNRFGTGLLESLLPAIESGIRGFGDLLNRILAFTQTKQFTKIVNQLRRSFVALKPELRTLTTELGVLFDRLVENGPRILRGFTAVVDSVLDIINAVLPVIQFFVDVLGEASEAFANFTARSERAEQRVRQGNALGVLEQQIRTVFGGSQVTNRGRLREGRNLELNVNVTGDTGVVEEVAVEAADSRVSRRARQQSNRYFAQTGNINTNE